VPDLIRLSTEGSTEPPANNMSSKVIRRGELLFVGWLDAPRTRKDPLRLRLGTCDVTTGELQRVMTLGEGIDNHCGAAIVLDGNDRLHALLGAHHDFFYRWSDDPVDAVSWSAPDPGGPKRSYPALSVDESGTHGQ